MANINKLAASATLHCLTGCSIGEVGGLILGTAWNLHNTLTIALSIGLAFLFGYALSLLPILRSGVSFWNATKLVLAADTLSILTMEIVDTLIVLVIPGAMDAGLADPLFWISLGVALVCAFAAAFPVNRFLLLRGKGHALVHEYHHAGHH